MNATRHAPFYDISVISHKEELIAGAFRKWSDLLMFVIFSLMAVIGILMNVILLIGCLKRRMHKSPRDKYIMNVILADLLIAIGLVLSPTINYTIWINNNDPIEQITCKIVEMIRDITGPVCLITLTILSRERYRSVFQIKLAKDESEVNEREQKVSLKKQKRPFFLFNQAVSLTGFQTCVFIWGLSIASIVPISVLGRLPDVPITDVADNDMMCMMDRFQIMEPKIIVIARSALMFVIPFIIIVYNYIGIIRRLMYVSTKVSERSEKRNPAVESTMRRILRTARKMFLLAVLFIICAAPFQLILWIFYFSDKMFIDRHEEIWQTWRAIGFYLFHLHPIFNPVLLFMSSPKYQSILKSSMCCCKRVDDSSPGITVTDDNDNNEDDDDEYVKSPDFKRVHMSTSIEESIRKSLDRIAE